MENFGIFYEQMIFYSWFIAGSIAILLTIGRLVQLFFRYINTGKFGNFQEDCFINNLFEGDCLSYAPALYCGTHPGGIFADLLSYMVLTFIAGIVWLPLVITLPLVGLAYLLRKRIAKKQEFMARLEGTHPDTQDNGGSADMSAPQSSAGGGTV